MKKISTLLSQQGVLFILVFGLAFNAAFAQQATTPISLGSIQEFKNTFITVDPAGKNGYALQLASNKEVLINITEKNCEKNSCYVFGTIEGHEQATFVIKGDETTMNGKVLFRKSKEAYDIYTNAAGKVLIVPVDINDVICVDYFNVEDNSKPNTTPGTMAVPIFNSLPGAYATVYLDFDGELVSGGYWGTINAAPRNFSDADITKIWQSVAEDFSPLNVNITTERAVFNAAPVTKRMMVVFTPTSTASPGAGGTSYLNSFGWTTGECCWVFAPTITYAQLAASHEIGHTLGPNHDGTAASPHYYGGHANWAPIMGNGHAKPIVHWSKGEYASANNLEDDLSLMSNKAPFRVDDAGNDTSTTKMLVIEGTGSGVVSSNDNFGVIEKRTDKDVFKFITTGGPASLTIKSNNPGAGSNVPDLDIQARLLDANGNEIVKVDPLGLLTIDVIISQTLTAGTYYLEIDGVGAGDPYSGGYSDYGSIGKYFISGNIPSTTTTGVKVTENNYAINIFPNPSSGLFTINIPKEGNNESNIEIINSLGQSVFTSREITSGNIYQEINISGHAAGIYCVVVRSGADVWKGNLLLK